MDIEVLAVWKVQDNPPRWAVELEAGNVVFRMQLIGGKPVIVSRRHIDAQVYDPENLWVPKWVHVKIYRQGAKILRDRERHQVQART